MKITKITIHNFLKLKDIDFNPSKTNVIVGKNKQGKTSILKAIKAAFDGEIDESSIRIGENKAEITIELDDIDIKRTITEKGNYLDISNKDGMKMPSPQHYLNGILGTFSFNPVQFFELKPVERKNYLLSSMKISINQEELAEYTGEKLKGIDYEQHALDVVNDARKYYYDKRTAVNSEVTKKRKTLDELSSDIPEGFDPASVSEDKIKELQLAIKEDELAHQKQLDHEKFVQNLQTQEKSLLSEIEDVEKTLAEKKAKLAELQKEIAAGADFQYDASDPTTIEVAKETLTKLESQRELVFTHKRVEEVRGELSVAVKEAGELDLVVKRLTKEVPQALVAKADLPIEGLTVTEDDLLVNGVSLDNLSSSEQLKFALNIVRKLNEKLKVINIDGIETLDEDNFEAFLKEIENDDYQYFVTRVDGSGAGNIVIEDGVIKK